MNFANLAFDNAFLHYWPVAAVLLALLLLQLLARRFSIPWVLRTLRTKPIQEGSTLAHVSVAAASIAYKHRLAKPKLYVLPEFTPNAMALRGARGSISLVLSEGLLQSFTQEELDAVLTLLLAQASFRQAIRGPILSWHLRPLFALLDHLPKIFWLVLSPALSTFVRLWLRPKRIFRSDRRAYLWRKSPDLGAAMQKLVALGRKLPMHHWNLAIDHLFLVSPLQVEAASWVHFSTQPPIERRLRRLQEQSFIV